MQEIRFGERFQELHHQIWGALREEVERAYERTAQAPRTMEDHDELRVAQHAADQGRRRRTRRRSPLRPSTTREAAASWRSGSPARSLAILIFGGWELLTARGKIVDKFFWGRPSGIVTQLSDWIKHGTQYGSIWTKIWITMKEAVLGFALGREQA